MGRLCSTVFVPLRTQDQTCLTDPTVQLPLHLAAADLPAGLLRPSATNVSGDIVADTTWTLAGSPWVLTGDITVTVGVTLTVEPGVAVKGSSGAELRIQGHLLALGGKTADEQEGMRLAEQALADGRGWEMFKRLVKAQGGDVAYIENPELLPAARLVEVVPAPCTGYLSGINARIVGQTVVLLGGGRSKKGDQVDYAVGVVIHHKVGDQLTEGEPLFTLHANDPKRLEEARLSLLEAHTWSNRPIQPLPLFYGVVKGH